MSFVKLALEKYLPENDVAKYNIRITRVNFTNSALILSILIVI